MVPFYGGRALITKWAGKHPFNTIGAEEKKELKNRKEWGER